MTGCPDSVPISTTTKGTHLAMSLDMPQGVIVNFHDALHPYLIPKTFLAVPELSQRPEFGGI
jgi:hypothetical protein